MKFGSVEIPADLVKSLQENRVVVFAGAGVSMGQPANLPDFVTLTKKILNLDPTEKVEYPDQKLGEGFDRGVKIHEQCIRILKQSNPKPTKLHFDILKLFSQVPRIITTNFDLLFEEAYESMKGLKPRTYTAPVLPTGKNIEGVIYIHGDIRDPRSMVLSDADFGRAYLSESWAKRLLIEAFLEYDFIFIGYSYNDTILKYLTRTLPKDKKSKLYAFANIEEGNIQQVHHWQSLGIKPLTYQKENGTHQQLPESVEKLAEFLNFDAKNYEKFIDEKIRSFEKNQSEDDLKYIEFILDSDDSYREFYKIANPNIWLKTIKNHQNLFDILMKHESVFFQWLIKFLESHLNDLMSLCLKYSSLKLHQNFIWQVFRKLDDLQDKTIYLKWFLFLEKELYSTTNLSNGVHSWVLIKLIDFDLNIEFKRAFDNYLSIQSYPELQFVIKEYNINRIVNRIKAKDFFHFDAVKILGEKIIIYNNYLKLYNQEKLHTAWERKEIWEKDENYGQNLEYELINSIIEIISEKKLTQDEVNGFSKSCLYSESVLLQRLGTYLLSQFSSYDADFIYSLMNLQIDWLDPEFQSEIFKFCELQYKNLSFPRKKELLTKIFTSKRSEYCKLQWFAWIYKFATECELVKEKYNQLKVKFPSFILEDKPYLAWHSSGVYTVAHLSPFTTTEIESRTDYIWYVELLEYDFYQFSFNHGDELGYVGLWQEIVQVQPQWLLDFLDFSVQIMPEHKIITKIIEVAKNWQFDLYTHEKFYKIFLKILSFKDKEQIYAISHFLSDLNEIVYYQNDLDKYAEWVEVAKQIIHFNVYTESNFSGRDAFTESLNSINGALTWFIIKIYEQAKSNDQVSNQCEIFIKLLVAQDLNGYAIIWLFEKYSFLKSRNSLFAQKYLLPLFSSQNKKYKIQAWKGYLRNKHLEFSEFREIHKEFYSVMDYALNQNDEGFIKGLTDLYVYSIYFDYHENADEALKKLERLENHHIAEQILQTTRQILVREKDIEKVWLWLEEYLFDRIYNVNQIIIKSEISLIWYLLTDHSQMIENLYDIILSIPFEEEWFGFLHDMGRNHSDIVIGYENKWCEVLAFYLDQQNDHIAGSCFEEEISFLRRLIAFDSEEKLKRSLAKKGINLK